MASVTEFIADGSGSATVAGVSGKTHYVTRIIAAFTSPGQSGTLTLEDVSTSTTLWSGVVYGALDACFTEPFAISYGGSATASLSGANVRLSGYTE